MTKTTAKVTNLDLSKKWSFKTGWCYFKDQKLYLLDGGALAYSHHVDDDGNVIEPFEESYAHLSDDGKIYRFKQVIGEYEDLIFEGYEKFFDSLGKLLEEEAGPWFNSKKEDDWVEVEWGILKKHIHKALKELK